ncbi:hypothetical protein AVEN_20069-1 [Araneus ventricosus]|uniref:Uncharacterized protein n=1 Tax=Araneus ventricosus TaxID=182803 RepID=A0A4Y2UWF1_ARAVE|nr:hypothetical protein AVEN_20069-1 [Araneus ventricosus]
MLTKSNFLTHQQLIATYGNCVYCPSETGIGTILKESFTVNLIEQVPPLGFSLPKTSFLEILSFLKTVEKSSEKCIDLFCSKLSSLVQHNFIAKQQRASFNYRKGVYCHL